MLMYIALSMAMFWTALFELTGESWMSVFSWISWWAVALVMLQDGQVELSLLPFMVGVLYFFRMLFRVVEPKKLKRMFEAW